MNRSDVLPRFLADTATHELRIVVDDGAYRLLLCRRDTGCGRDTFTLAWFRLLAWISCAFRVVDGSLILFQTSCGSQLDESPNVVPVFGQRLGKPVKLIFVVLQDLCITVHPSNQVNDDAATRQSISHCFGLLPRKNMQPTDHRLGLRQIYTGELPERNISGLLTNRLVFREENDPDFRRWPACEPSIQSRMHYGELRKDVIPEEVRLLLAILVNRSLRHLRKCVCPCSKPPYRVCRDRSNYRCKKGTGRGPSIPPNNTAIDTKLTALTKPIHPAHSIPPSKFMVHSDTRTDAGALLHAI